MGQGFQPLTFTPSPIASSGWRRAIAIRIGCSRNDPTSPMSCGCSPAGWEARVADWPYNTAAWKRLRLAKLAASPLCAHCAGMGRTVPGVHVDHVVPINAGGPAFPALDGLQSLCAPCHSRKTRGEQTGRLSGGCDADGVPTDGRHHWHAEGDRGESSRDRAGCGPPSPTNTHLLAGFGGSDDGA